MHSCQEGPEKPHQMPGPAVGPTEVLAHSQQALLHLLLCLLRGRRPDSQQQQGLCWALGHHSESQNHLEGLRWDPELLIVGTGNLQSRGPPPPALLLQPAPQPAVLRCGAAPAGARPSGLLHPGSLWSDLRPAG